MGRVVIIHPDLGIGGAERLMVDAGLALQNYGHSVIIYTGYHDKSRCFEETQNGILKTVTVGSWIPRAIFGRCHALMAYLKMIYIAIYLLIFSQHDLILCDQVSACVPFLKLDFRNRPKIIFYCHFPDQLLTKRDSLLKSIYRKPIDFFEEWSIRKADTILVNSKFTGSIVKKTFKTLKNRELEILYPCVNVDRFLNFKPSKETCLELSSKCKKMRKDAYVFLSLNRFERKKNLALAIEAFKDVIAGYKKINKRVRLVKAHLIVAGGYDARLLDSVQYYEELECLVSNLGLDSNVTFIKSPSDNEKLLLLALSHAIVYTPENEHFGIVPLEAMAMSKPVIACASGGPLETVKTGHWTGCGILCDSNKHSFANAMLLLLVSNRIINETMGRHGLERVRNNFSFEKFSSRLNEICYPKSTSSK